MRVLPAPSAISLVCARLGWSRREVEALSLHGRPGRGAPPPSGARRAPDRAEPRRRRRRTGSPALLAARGFGAEPAPGASSISAARTSAAARRLAAAWRPARFAALNTVAIECARAGADASRGRACPGLPDEAFRSRRHADQARGAGRDARAADAAARAAACGTSAPAAARSRSSGCARPAAAGRSRSSATPARCALIAGQRRARSARPSSRSSQGRAPGRLAGLPAPDAVFVGGGSRAPGPARGAAGRRCGRAAGWSPTRSRSRASGRCSTGTAGTAASWCGSRSPRLEPLGRLTPGARRCRSPSSRLVQAVSTGRLIGIGVGPGDPELLTLKAVRDPARARRWSPTSRPTAGRASPAQIAAVHLAGRPARAQPRAADAALSGAGPGGLRRGRRRGSAPSSSRAATSPCSARAIRCSTARSAICSPGWPTATRSRSCRAWPRSARPRPPRGSRWSCARESLVVVPATLPDEPLRRPARAAPMPRAILKLGRHLAKVRQVLAELGLLERRDLCRARQHRARARDARSTDVARRGRPISRWSWCRRTGRSGDRQPGDRCARRERPRAGASGSGGAAGGRARTRRARELRADDALRL